MSTEYRFQFVWPKLTGTSNKNDDNHVLEPPRKSQSMGAIKSSHQSAIAGIHKKRTTNEKEGAT